MASFSSQAAHRPGRAKVALSSVILAMMLVGVLVAALRVAVQTTSEKHIGPAAAVGVIVGALTAVLWTGGEASSFWKATLRFVLGWLIGGLAGGLAVAPYAFPTLLFGGTLMVLFALAVRRFSARPVRREESGPAGVEM